MICLLPDALIAALPDRMLNHLTGQTNLQFMKNPFILALLFILSFQIETNAQNVWARDLEKQFSTYLENNFQEKIYVHTDKYAYLAGEILWLKVYNVEAYTHWPCNVSKVAYIEVLNKENKPVL